MDELSSRTSRTIIINTRSAFCSGGLATQNTLNLSMVLFQAAITFTNDVTVSEGIVSPRE